MSAVTVAIPVLNGGPRLAAVLDAVRAQDFDGEVELLVCDSGSTDGSQRIARDFGARFIEIERRNFSHGGTRNLLMEQAAGDHVAFLTQDARPAARTWLARLIGGFALAPDAALTFGSYCPRPDASVMTARELSAWFSSFAPDGRPRIDRLAGAERDVPAAALLGPRAFFTDANGCVSKAAWREVPFLNIAYAEDHQLAIDMLRAGYAKVFVPDAAVEHSHDYSAWQRMQRSFDEWRALREVYGWIEPLSTTTLRDRVVRPARADVRWARERGATIGTQVGLAARALVYHAARTTGAALGSRHDRLPSGLRRLSLESPAVSPPLADWTEIKLPGLLTRILLTYRYRGLRTVIWHLVCAPLRFTRFRGRLKLGSTIENEQAAARAWYRLHGRPVTIVIPSYGNPTLAAAAVASVRKTTIRDMVRIVVADDASADEHVRALRATNEIDEIVAGEQNIGFGGNTNRGLRASSPEDDVVVLNVDVIALPGWLECLQFTAYGDENIGIVGGKLLYSNDRIQHAGVHRHLRTPQWFDHRHRSAPADHGPANVGDDVLAVTGACMYVKREVIERIGIFDERYPMAYEDVDWCLRAWQAGYRVVYAPAATLRHLESITRGPHFGERERVSQEAFWERWGDFFDRRPVRDPDGRLRIIYVTEETGVGGGHRDIFEHLNRLIERGHDARLYSLGVTPEWFALRAPVTTFKNYADLVEALRHEDAIKVATWWKTAAPVWRASVLRGIPVYFVQDIETSYYPTDEVSRHRVLASYRPEFHYMTISGWNRDRLRDLRLTAALIPPGIDLETFRPLDVTRRDDMVLALGRTNPLKNLSLTVDAWKALPGHRPELCLFGIEAELGPQIGATYVERPSDEKVNALLNAATVFVQTSKHEGFCLPLLEAMATGAAVVCTDAHGNRDFCVDGYNCLMVPPTVAGVSAAMATLLADEKLCIFLGKAGLRTAQHHAWEKQIDALLDFYEDLANGGSPSCAPATPTRLAR